MKKLFIIIVAIIILSLISTYIFVPSKAKFSKIEVIHSNVKSAERFLNKGDDWNKWFSALAITHTNTLQDKKLRFNQYTYEVNKISSNGIPVSITNNKINLSSIINIIPLSNDSVAIEWKSEMPQTMNPVKMWKNYTTASQIKNNMGSILQVLKRFLEKSENVYGISIKEIKVTDTLLISESFETIDFPTIPNIYFHINKIKELINHNGAKQTSYPMLHIFNTGNNYQTMIAIPVNKRIPEIDGFSFKRMVSGNILVAEVNGGDSSISRAYQQIENYVIDNQRSPIAISFQSLVTDRMKEPDSSRWITKIYFPVI